MIQPLTQSVAPGSPSLSVVSLATSDDSLNSDSSEELRHLLQCIRDESPYDFTFTSQDGYDLSQATVVGLEVFEKGACNSPLYRPTTHSLPLSLGNCVSFTGETRVSETSIADSLEVMFQAEMEEDRRLLRIQRESQFLVELSSQETESMLVSYNHHTPIHPI